MASTSTGHRRERPMANARGAISAKRLPRRHTSNGTAQFDGTVLKNRVRSIPSTKEYIEICKIDSLLLPPRGEVRPDHCNRGQPHPAAVTQKWTGSPARRQPLRWRWAARAGWDTFLRESITSLHFTHREPIRQLKCAHPIPTQIYHKSTSSSPKWIKHD